MGSSADQYRSELQTRWKKGRIEVEDLTELTACGRRLGLSELEMQRLELEVFDGRTRVQVFSRGLPGQAPVEEVPRDEQSPESSGHATISGAATLAAPEAQLEGSEVAVGGIIRGRYQVIERIGVGGMGVVYRVADQQMGGERALKILRREWSRTPKFKELLKDEVRKTRDLVHRNIVRVYDYDEDPELGPFFTMDLIQGERLDHWLAGREGSPAPRAVVEWIADQLSAALEFAHDRRVLHRDLKPQNIMLDRSAQRLWVLDFGIARTMTEDERHSLPGVAGTPFFMAPEVEQGQRSIGPAADVFALGGILYQLVSGVVPRGALEDPGKIRERSPVGRGEQFSRSTTQLILDALAPVPSERPALASLRAAFGSAELDQAQGVVEELDHASASTASLKEAASKGDPESQFMLSGRLAMGDGVERDLEGAARLCLAAAASGHAAAQFQAGVYYELGQGLPVDTSEARHWYSEAVAADYEGAQAALQRVSEDGGERQGSVVAAMDPHLLEVSGETPNAASEPVPEPRARWRAFLVIGAAACLPAAAAWAFEVETQMPGAWALGLALAAGAGEVARRLLGEGSRALGVGSSVAVFLLIWLSLTGILPILLSSLAAAAGIVAVFLHFSSDDEALVGAGFCIPAACVLLHLLVDGVSWFRLLLFLGGVGFLAVFLRVLVDQRERALGSFVAITGALMLDVLLRLVTF